ncbi:MAG: hypothetical protein ACK4XK_12625, partial [Casimicrobiaceae bacterium]
MKRITVMTAVAALIVCASAAAQRSTGPVLPPDELIRQQQQRTVEQPYNNAPLWSTVRGAVEGSTTLPAPEAGVLIQDGGQTWRALRNGTVSVWGGWALVLAFLGVVAFYAWRGTIPLKEPPTGRMIERFTLAERIVHWTTAISFSILAITGLILGFGKHILIPIFGQTLFSWLATLSKTLHNFVGPVFIVASLLLFFT